MYCLYSYLGKPHESVQCLKCSLNGTGKIEPSSSRGDSLFDELLTNFQIYNIFELVQTVDKVTIIQVVALAKVCVKIIPQ